MAAQSDLQRLWSEGAAAYTSTAYEGGAILLQLNRELASILVKNLPQEGKAKILDVASGGGEPACSIAALAPFAEVTATDYAEGMVAEAKRRAQTLNLANIRCEVADATKLSPFPDNTFDGLCCASALQLLLPNHDKAIKEFKRVLKPGGILVVSVWGLPHQTNCASLIGQVTRQMLPAKQGAGGACTLTLGHPDTLKKVLQEGGFASTETRDFNCTFEVTADELLANPMMIRIYEQMRSNGETDCKQKVGFAILAKAREGEYVKSDGKMLFPTNVAVIATARA